MAAPKGQGRWMQSAVGFGGYPEFQGCRAAYDASEPKAPEGTREKLEEELTQLRPALATEKFGEIH